MLLADCHLEMDSPKDEPTEALPPPPPVIPPNVVPIKADPERSPPKKPAKPKRILMPRPGLAKRGQPIQLLTNHFKVSVQNVDDYFYHYSVCPNYRFYLFVHISLLRLCSPNRITLANLFCIYIKVNLKYEDDRPVEGKGVGRKVIDKLHQTYDEELGKKDFAYDGEKSLFTIGSLPQVKNEFTVVLEDMSSNK